MPDCRDSLRRAYTGTLFSAPSTVRLFNPYRDREAALDVPDAPARRRANLLAALEAMPRGPVDVLVVAEAPGPRGCRFSGLPFTSEGQLLDPAFPVGGRPSSVRFEQTGKPYREPSGTVFWRVMAPYAGRFWVWNTVPLHPHRAGVPLSVRAPTAAEARAWHGLVALHVTALAPRAVVAVGRHAERALAEIGAGTGVVPTYVRHPSQGGAAAFADGMAAVWTALG